MGETSTTPSALNVACRLALSIFFGARGKPRLSATSFTENVTLVDIRLYYCFIAYNTSRVAMKLDERQLQLPLMCLTKTLLTQNRVGPMNPHHESYSCCPPAHIQDELLLDFDGLPYSWKHSVPLLLVLVTKLSAISVLFFLRPRHHLANRDDQKQ